MQKQSKSMSVGNFKIVHAEEKLPFPQNTTLQFYFYIVLLPKANVTHKITPICTVSLQAKCLKLGKGNICLRRPFPQSQIEWNLRLNSRWHTAEHKGKRDLFSAAVLEEAEMGEKKKSKEYFINTRPQAVGILIFWQVQHFPALTYLTKTKGKLGSK